MDTSYSFNGQSQSGISNPVLDDYYRSSPSESFTDPLGGLLVPVQLDDPITLTESTNKRVHRYLGNRDAPLYLNELKTYHRKHIPVSPNSSFQSTPTPQELSYTEENEDFNVSLLPIGASSLMQHRRIARDGALQESQISAIDTTSSLGLSQMELPLISMLPVFDRPLTSTPNKNVPGLRTLRLPTLRSTTTTPVDSSPLSGSLPTIDRAVPMLASPNFTSSDIIGPVTSDAQPNLHTMTLSELDTGSYGNLTVATVLEDNELGITAMPLSGQSSILQEVYGQSENPLTSPAHDESSMFHQHSPPIGVRESMTSTVESTSSHVDSEATTTQWRGQNITFPTASVSAITAATPPKRHIITSPPSATIELNAEVSNIQSPEDVSSPCQPVSAIPHFEQASSVDSMERLASESTSGDDVPAMPYGRHARSLSNTLSTLLGPIGELEDEARVLPTVQSGPFSPTSMDGKPPKRKYTVDRRKRVSLAFTSAPAKSITISSPRAGPTAPRYSITPSLTLPARNIVHTPSPLTPRTPSTVTSTPSSSSRPNLFFALASDSPAQVSKILSMGEADANDTAGPFDLPALVFSLTNDALRNKTAMVKTLLAHGADPSVVQHLVPGSKLETPQAGEDGDESPLTEKLKGSMNPAIRYYLGRQEGAASQSQVAALQAGRYDPLLRARFHLVGQDLVLDELMRAVASHARRRQKAASLALVLVGPSGHGKSHLGSKSLSASCVVVGALLQAPVYIVNMTNLRSQEDLMHAQSLAPESENSQDLLAFLTRHEEKRCVVVLEEIEKTAEKHVLHTLLMPWELGKLPIAASTQIINTSEVVWIATSNAGEQLVFDFNHAKKDPNVRSTRDEYSKLMARMRGQLADELGASIVSRVDAVLPFLPFTIEEQRALASEMLDDIASEGPTPAWLTSQASEALVDRAVENYFEREGARSIHRAVQVLYEEGMDDEL